MLSRLALSLLLVMVTYTEVRVYAQAQQADKAPSWPPMLSPERPEGIPDNVPWPPPIDKLPPLPNPLPDVPSDVKGLEEPPVGTGSSSVDVLQRHRKELEKNPDVLGLIPGNGEILIVTDRPANVPTQIEGIPVKIVPPPPTLPPPPGVIVLRHGGIIERREDLEACPEGFREATMYRWRFCQPSGNPEPLPSNLLNPPVAGVPYEEAEKIFRRNADWLLRLGSPDGSVVNRAGLGAEGITVETNTPALVPTNIEGLPVKAIPIRGEIVGANHTMGTPVRPTVHGGIFIGDPAWGSLNGGTAGAVVVSQGKPWITSAAHNLSNCESAPLCPPCDPPLSCPTGYKQFLNQFPHNQGEILQQPATTPPGPVTTIGRSSRWT